MLCPTHVIQLWCFFFLGQNFSYGAYLSIISNSFSAYFLLLQVYFNPRSKWICALNLWNLLQLLCEDAVASWSSAMLLVLFYRRCQQRQQQSPFTTFEVIAENLILFLQMRTLSCLVPCMYPVHIVDQIDDPKWEIKRSFITTVPHDYILIIISLKIVGPTLHLWHVVISISPWRRWIVDGLT